MTHGQLETCFVFENDTIWAFSHYVANSILMLCTVLKRNICLSQGNFCAGKKS